MINQRLGRKSFRLCIEKEEQNDSCDSYQIDKQWTNVRAYPIKCKDELEALKYFTEGWNWYPEDKFHNSYYQGL